MLIIVKFSKYPTFNTILLLILIFNYSSPLIYILPFGAFWLILYFNTIYFTNGKSAKPHKAHRSWLQRHSNNGAQTQRKRKIREPCFTLAQSGQSKLVARPQLRPPGTPIYRRIVARLGHHSTHRQRASSWQFATRGIYHGEQSPVWRSWWHLAHQHRGQKTSPV